MSFSIDGTAFPATPDVFIDIQSFTADPLIIDLNGKNGRAVQLKLFFADEWIILSETRFISGKQETFLKRRLSGLPNSPLEINHQLESLKALVLIEIHARIKINAQATLNVTLLKL